MVSTIKHIEQHRALFFKSQSIHNNNFVAVEALERERSISRNLHRHTDKFRIINQA